ncbi:hypothetical protein ACFQ1L_14985 [Phytohabitans flavus]|uniref:hypothetical protein n=1 Tax=Phytohabitans flavus TaxID=1076124 RepID=UPI00362DB429
MTAGGWPTRASTLRAAAAERVATLDVAEVERVRGAHQMLAEHRADLGTDRCLLSG